MARDLFHACILVYLDGQILHAEKNLQMRFFAPKFLSERDRLCRGSTCFVPRSRFLLSEMLKIRDQIAMKVFGAPSPCHAAAVVNDALRMR